MIDYWLLMVVVDGLFIVCLGECCDVDEYSCVADSFSEEVSKGSWLSDGSGDDFDEDSFEDELFEERCEVADLCVR